MNDTNRGKVLLACQILGVIALSTLLNILNYSGGMELLISAIWLVSSTVWVIEGATLVADSKSEIAVVTLSFAIKAILAMRRYIEGHILLPLSDGWGFWQVAQEYNQGQFIREYTLYPYILNIEFKVFGENYLCAMIVNMLFTTFSAIIVIFILNQLRLHGRLRMLIVLLASLYPYMVLISVEIWREAIYVFLFALSFSYYVDYAIGKGYSKLILASASLLPVLALHGGYFPAIMVYFLFGRRRSEGRLLESNIFPPLLSAAFLVVFLSLSTNVQGAGYLTRSLSNPEELLDRLSGLGSVTAGSSYLMNLRADTWGKALLYAPIRIFYYLCSPLPWDCRGIRDILTFLLDSSIHLLFMIQGARALVCYKDTEASELDPRINLAIDVTRTAFWIVLLCALVFGFGTSAAGTAIRHRVATISLEAVGIGCSNLLLDCKRFNRNEVLEVC